MKSFFRRAALGLTKRMALARVDYLTRRYDRSTAVTAAVREAIKPASVLRHLGVALGEDVRIRPGLTLILGAGDVSSLTIGDNVFIGSDVLVDLTAPVAIESNVVIGAGSQLITHISFGSGPLADRYPARSAPLTIGNGAYLGARTMVLEDVSRVGARSVLGAGAVLRQDTQPESTWVGVPARRLSG